MIIRRDYYSNKISQLSEQFPAVCLLGPRQVGKTTLAREYAKKIPPNRVHFFDLENVQDIEALSNPELVLNQLEGLIIIDEVQKRPELFPALRVLIDQSAASKQFLILGSASPQLLKQTSETLAGRIAYLEIPPFDLIETNDANMLWLRGGYPRSYLSKTDEQSFEWRKQYVRTFLEQDIPNLGIKIAPLNLRRFWMMLAHYHGNLVSMEEISRSLGINGKSIKHYLDILTGTYMLRQLQPWWENISKRQVKSPKVYFRDSGILHYLLDIENSTTLYKNPKLGASWEGFALEEILRSKHIDAENCYFWSTHQEAELDLLVFHAGKRIGFEFKYAEAPKLTKSMRIAFQDLKLDELNVIYPGNKSYLLEKDIKVINLNEYIKIPL